MVKKILIGFSTAFVLTLTIVSPALAESQNYKFYYYEDRDTSGMLSVGDTCWRTGVTLTKGMFMNNPPYNTWIYSFVGLLGSSFTVNNITDITTCKTTSSNTQSLTVGVQHLLKDQYGTTVYFTPAGGGTGYQGLIGGNGNF